MNKNLLLLMTFVFAWLNLLSAALGVTYQYNSLNRLTLVKYDDSNMIHYIYDAAGNRTKMVRIGEDNQDLDSDEDGTPDRLELLEYGDLVSNETGDQDTDADGDDLPDWWEQQIIDAYDFDEIEAIADVLPSDDFDRNGASNEDEFIAGTDPTDPNDVLRIVMPLGRSEQGILIRWKSVPDRDYRIERSSDLTGASPFSILATGISGRDGITEYLDKNPPNSTTLFYRIAVEISEE